MPLTHTPAAKPARIRDIAGPLASSHAANPDIEHLLRTHAITIVHDSRSGWYNPIDDVVHMPELHDIARPYARNGKRYYALLLHELAHWTGKRLGRPLPSRRTLIAYAQEEVTAELTALVLSLMFGLRRTTQGQSLRYLATWMRFLAAHPDALTKAKEDALNAIAFLAGERVC